MTTLKLLVQFEPGERTRWLFTPAEITKQLRDSAEVVLRNATTGPEPRVSVILEEQPETPGNGN